MVHLVVKLIVFLQTCRTILLLHDVHLRRRDLHVELHVHLRLHDLSICDMFVNYGALCEL